MAGHAAIAAERPHQNAADEDAISEVTVAAFNSLQVSKHTEQFIIKALRAANALAVSLVAGVEGRVIGHRRQGSPTRRAFLFAPFAALERVPLPR